MGTGTLPPIPSPSLDKSNLCPYERDHDGIQEWAMQYVECHRGTIGLEEPWSILVKVICPTALSPAHKAHEASIEWDSEVWFARVELVCNLPFLLRQWVLIHELYELKHWRTGDAFHDLVVMIPPSELREVLRQKFYAARNQEIEQEVGQYLGFRRPNHIVSPPLPKSGGLMEILQKWEREDAEESPDPEILNLTSEEMENIRL